MALPENPHGNNPLHGVKRQEILEYLIENEGWEEMGKAVNINCFHSNQTLKSGLKFLRTTPWAREKVEEYYLKCIKSIPMKKKD